jgi:hypothetical protein
VAIICLVVIFVGTAAIKRKKRDTGGLFYGTIKEVLAHFVFSTAQQLKFLDNNIIILVKHLCRRIFEVEPCILNALIKIAFDRSFAAVSAAAAVVGIAVDLRLNVRTHWY